MKTINIIIFILALLTFFKGNSQTMSDCSKKAGVYTTFEFFNMNAYSDSVCLDNSKNKIKLRSFNTVVIISNGQKRKYKEGQLFGYFNGEHLRRYSYNKPFSANGYYTVLDTNGIVIYAYTRYGHTTFYFYSKDMNSPIKSLVIDNLEKDFQNVDFINAIKSLKNLTAKSGNTYEINNLYKKYYR